MKHRILLLLTVLTALVGGVACDDDPKGNNANNANNANNTNNTNNVNNTNNANNVNNVNNANNLNNVDPGQFLARFQEEVIAVVCDQFVNCPEPDTDITFQTVEDCEAFMGLFAAGMVNEARHAISEGARISEANFETCKTAIAALECGEDADSVPECRQIFNGVKAVGAGCAVHMECASGNCDTSLACPGVCAATGGAGDPCEVVDQCDFGLVCDTYLGECAADAGAGEGGPCHAYASGECDYGFSCVVEEAEPEPVEGTCQAWAGEGEACDTDWSGTLPQCDPALSCDTVSGLCATFTWVGQGQVCDDTHRCDFSEQLICLEVGGPNRLCTRIPGDGEACMMGQYCFWGHYCGADVLCHPLKDFGATCGGSDECQTDLCGDGGTCEYDPCAGEIDG